VRIERVEIVETGDDWPLLRDFECLWVSLASRAVPSPISHMFLNWVDWKLAGVISRFILDDPKTSSQTVFVPTMKKLPVPYVAIGSSQEDWNRFLHSCEGLKVNRVLYLCENPMDRDSVVKALTKISRHKHPEHIAVA